MGEDLLRSRPGLVGREVATRDGSRNLVVRTTCFGVVGEDTGRDVATWF